MDPQANLQRLYEEAKAEGGGLVVGAGGDAPAQADQFHAAFRERFPDVDIEVRLDLSKDLEPEINYQHIKGELEFDVAHLQTLQSYPRWKEEGRLESFRPEGLDMVQPGHVDPDGTYYAVFVAAFANVVDTGQIPEDEAPREMTDYLKPEFKDRIVLVYPHDDDAVLFQFEQIINKHGWGWLDNLLEQNPQWVRGTFSPLTVIGSGDKAVTFTSFYYLNPPEGDTLRFITPERDFFQSWFQLGAIFKGVRHPAAARLYMSHLLSEDYQRAWPQWSVRTDVPPPDGFRPLLEYPNTSPDGFRKFMADRERVERLKGIMQEFIGPVEGPSPTREPAAWGLA